MLHKCMAGNRMPGSTTQLCAFEMHNLQHAGMQVSRASAAGYPRSHQEPCYPSQPLWVPAQEGCNPCTLCLLGSSPACCHWHWQSGGCQWSYRSTPANQRKLDWHTISLAACLSMGLLSVPSERTSGCPVGATQQGWTAFDALAICS